MRLRSKNKYETNDEISTFIPPENTSKISSTIKHEIEPLKTKSPKCSSTFWLPKFKKFTLILILVAFLFYVLLLNLLIYCPNFVMNLFYMAAFSPTTLNENYCRDISSFKIIDPENTVSLENLDIDVYKYSTCDNNLTNLSEIFTENCFYGQANAWYVKSKQQLKHQKQLGKNLVIYAHGIGYSKCNPKYRLETYRNFLAYSESFSSYFDTVPVGTFDLLRVILRF